MLPLLLLPSRSLEESYVSNLHVSQPPQPGHRTQKANSLLSPPAWPLGYFYLPLSGDHKGRERDTPLRDREAGIQRLTGAETRQWGTQGQKLSYRESDTPTKRPSPPETENKETQRGGTTERPLRPSSSILLTHPGRLNPRERTLAKPHKLAEADAIEKQRVRHPSPGLRHYLLFPCFCLQLSEGT